MWSNSATTESISGLTAGLYSIQITDANGCTFNNAFTINEPSAIAVSAVTVDASSCSSNDGMIDISVSGGTPGYTFVWSNAATTEDISGLDGGAYSVTITDANGCVDISSYSITEPGAPIVTYSEPIDTACSIDGAFTLSGETPLGGTFSGPGVSGNTFDPTIANIGMNVISYSYTDSVGCTGSSMDSVYVDVCTDAPVSSLVSQVSIYPNPNNGTFTLQLNSNEPSDVLIFDAQGKLVYSQNVQPNAQYQMNISESGMYLITTINKSGERTSHRVVVNK